MPDPNAALRAARRQRGWKKAQLIVALERAAAQIGEKLPERANISRRIASWENDGVIPDERYRSLLCKAYGATPAELGIAARDGRMADDEPTRPISPQAQRSRPVDDAHDGDVPALVEDLSSPVIEWLLGRPNYDASHVGAGHRVRIRDVDAILATREAFRALDFQFGGGHTRSALVEYYRQGVRPLLDSTYNDQVGKALYVAAAGLVQLIGWMAYDAGDHPEARHYFVKALRLAQVADDRMLGGGMLRCLSHQANWLGNTREATQLARAAQEGARGRATPTAMAMFAMYEARAHSAAGDERAAVVAMREAERAFERRRPEDDPAWLHLFDGAELAGELAHCFRDLNLTVQGREYVDQAISATSPAYPRTLGFVRMVRADLDLRRGEVEESLTSAREALSIINHMKSARARHYLTEYRARLQQYAEVAEVREFLDETSGESPI